jgi:hypothetical protein
MILVAGGLFLGLLLGCGISQVAVGLFNPLVPHNWDFIIQQTFMNIIFGFMDGAIAGWFGIWVMSKVV